MTDKELEDFIHHGETGFLAFAMIFGDGWAKQAIDIAKELRARLSQCDRCGEVNPAEIHTCTPKEQEPVGEVLDERGEVDWMSFVPPAGTSLYTSPPAQRKPLTSQERDAQRWRFLMENSYDSNRVTQFHVWEHSWNPHSQTGEPTEWKQRVRGIALIDFIDRAIEAAHGIKSLTQEDIGKAWEWAQKSSPYGVSRIEVFARAIEAKLKEKNT